MANFPGLVLALLLTVMVPLWLIVFFLSRIAKVLRIGSHPAKGES